MPRIKEISVKKFGLFMPIWTEIMQHLVLS